MSNREFHVSSIFNLMMCGIQSIYLSGAVGFSRVVKALQWGISAIKIGFNGKVIGFYVGWKLASFVTEIGQAIDEGKGINYGFGLTGPYIYAA